MKIFFLLLLLFFLPTKAFLVEIVENITKEEKKFGDWNIACEEDIMMGKIDCKVFSIFYNETSSIYIQPNNKIANQVVIMIPVAIENTNVKVKIDDNSIVISDIIEKKNEFGVIPFSPTKQKLMLSQLKNGENMFIRFTVRDLKIAGGMKEITAKISLAEFSKLLIYYDIKMNSRNKLI